MQKLIARLSLIGLTISIEVYQGLHVSADIQKGHCLRNRGMKAVTKLHPCSTIIYQVIPIGFMPFFV